VPFADPHGAPPFAGKVADKCSTPRDFCEVDYAASEVLASTSSQISRGCVALSAISGDSHLTRGHQVELALSGSAVAFLLSRQIRSWPS
jgi:hypothetical protein